MNHALLSPSSSNRWLICTPAPRLEESIPDGASKYALEGTLAHELAELICRYNANIIDQAQYAAEIWEAKQNPLYTKEMQDCCAEYASYVWNLCEDYHVIDFEVTIDFDQYAPEGHGTCDAIIVSDGRIDIIDFKYGKGVPVYASENTQMMIYALGALEMYDLLYDIKQIGMTIYQPRLENISTWELSANELIAWGEKVLRPAAALAYEGKGEKVAGDHCKFCKVRAKCRVCADYNLRVTDFSGVDADLLSDTDIAGVLAIADSVKSWLEDVKKYALNQALNHDAKFPGYKIVHGRSNRVIKDADKVIAALRDTGMKYEAFTDTRLKGIGELETLLGKHNFEDLVGPYLVKPEGAPTLVQESDPRQYFQRSPADDFKNINVEELLDERD